MPKHLLRPLLIIEFLIALEAVFTAWSEIGGQYHLDLMFWPWKLGVGLGSAWLITAITANLVNHEGRITGRALTFASLLLIVLATAGVVTWYYHLHEPADQDDDEDDDDQVTPALLIRSTGSETAGGKYFLPGMAGVSVADHRQAFLTAEGLLEFRHVRNNAVDAELRQRVRIGL